MGLHKGQQNCVGQKGKAGRKSAYQEHANQQLLEKMFFEILNKQEIQKKLLIGKYSLKELFVSKGFAGNERILLAIFNKLFPDGIKMSGDKDNPLIVSHTEDENLILDFHKKLKENRLKRNIEEAKKNGTFIENKN